MSVEPRSSRCSLVYTDLSYPRTVLVIDDDETVRRALKVALEAFGCRVLSASGPEAARELWTQSSSAVDLVVCDVEMPGTCGPDLIQELKPRRVLFVTGTPESLAGSDTSFPVIGKPFSVIELREAVHSLL